VDDLCLHYQRAGLVAEQTDSGTVSVRQTNAPDCAAERLAFRMHLCIWEPFEPGQSHAPELIPADPKP